MKRHFIWRPFVVLAATGALLAGCASTQSETAPTVKEDPQALLTTTYALIDAIAQQAPAWVRSGPVLVATFVDVDQLEHSTTLGRAVTEQASTRLVQLGFPVVEVKLRTNLFVKENTGELLLSREIGKIAAEQAARAVLVGTYAVGKRAVHLNAKLIDPVSGAILAAQDGVLPLDSHTKSLLR